MTAKLDPALCRTLIAEARRQYGLVEAQGYGVRAGTMRDIADQLEAALEELSHATAHDGDWLSKASRAMCETMLGDRDALRAKVRDLEKLVDELPPERAEAFRLHLGACATCQRDLEGHMQLDARLSALAESREPTTRSER